MSQPHEIVNIPIWKRSKQTTLKSPPPTDKALELNIMRSHYVAAVRRNSISGQSSVQDPCEFGWDLDNYGIKLSHVCFQFKSKLPVRRSWRRLVVGVWWLLQKINMCSCVKINLKCTYYFECNETMCNSQDYKVSLSNDWLWFFWRLKIKWFIMQVFFLFS